MRSSVNRFWPLAVLLLLPACGSSAGSGPARLPAASANGPTADYPVIVGEPFTIGSTTYTPSDRLNYDAVGYATVAAMGEGRVAGAHKTLPIPSYAEITALESGRTILLRLDRRGPMVNDALLELSPSAAAQLGLSPGSRSAIRVRRVNPPEPERAMLRGGGEAPERMETPEPLLKVLRRKLAGDEALFPPKAVSSSDPLPASEAGEGPIYTPPSDLTERGPVMAQVPREPPPVSTPAARLPFVVQVAAFSSAARADKVAMNLGGMVSKPGQYWHVQLGPFASEAEAAPSLQKAQSAGFTDARIQRVD